MATIVVIATVGEQDMVSEKTGKPTDGNLIRRKF